MTEQEQEDYRYKMLQLLVDELLYFRDGLRNVVAAADDPNSEDCLDDVQHVENLTALLEFITNKKI
ncbi:hypothetical protein Q4E40_02840 [Pontibacter sp. BT731]|uniref:hypothetical protein n=1 Tax=Pontibacter coccineus TaxID=3063328 RepID=UPI0026E2050F|nr:hypothetical protein [Pontibacter sp. BT731]MDO6389050.1 hypothetical protein [Pontibacter sp. BT731]